MRRKDRELTDTAVIRQTLDSARVMRVAMVDSGKPYVVPLNYAYTLENGVLDLYFHSAPVGRKMEILKENPSVFAEISVEKGLVGEGDEACVYGYSFVSIMGPGRASIVTNMDDKLAALKLLMKHQTGREGYSFSSDLSKVAVVRITLDSFSAKLRPGSEK